jgi:hypothetical protein
MRCPVLEGSTTIGIVAVSIAAVAVAFLAVKNFKPKRKITMPISIINVFYAQP